MGKQKGIILYSGKLGDQVGYYRKNKKGQKEWWTRRAPQHVRQTAATRSAATDFGTASKCSRLVRHALRPWLQHYGYHFDHNRLNKAFIDAVHADKDHKTGFKVPTHHSLQSLCGFHFNSIKATNEYLTDNPTITRENNNTTTVLVPAIHVGNKQAYKSITHITVKAIALSVNFSRNNTILSTSETVTIKRSDKHQAITLTLPSHKEQTLIILEIQCAYEINGRIDISANAQTAAMDIIAVLPATEQKKTRRIYRNKTPHLNFIPPYCLTVTDTPHKQRTPLHPLHE
jgi:hypothetical protein